MERSFFMVKPDGVERGLIGEIISRVEKKGLRIVAMEMLRVDRALARKHYAEHKGKPFFEDLVAYITSGPCVAMVVEGENAINVLREMIGKTNPKEAAAGTIRGDFGVDKQRNVVHASDSRESAEREITLFFRGSTG
ncbi:MAG: nucleoside-diphosphate kinase [Candidatus Hydrothermarchaeota archaeon]|nr:nucleoside-diphosphate kinase [Candidatus Hydrothermarchaeota archaeon]